MTGRSSLAVKLGRLFQKMPIGWVRPLEALWLSKQTQGGDRSQMVFLLALPRSGSTLTYQCLIHCFQPGYLSNLGNAIYQFPLWSAHLMRLSGKEYNSDFQSAHGFVSGLLGPAEGLKFWSYWLCAELDEQAPLSRSSKNLSYLQRVFSEITTPERPYLTGYLGHLFCWECLKDLFPEAVFIRLYRDPLSNAHSIYRSRLGGRETDWFSLRPSECEDLGQKPLSFQVAAQVYWLNRKLDALNGDRVIPLRYEDLCRNPTGEIERVRNACNSLGLELTARKPLPASFPCKVSDPQVDDDAARIQAALRALEQAHGKLDQPKTELNRKNKDKGVMS